MSEETIDSEVVIKKSQLQTIEAHLIMINGIATVLHYTALSYGKSAIARKMEVIAMKLKASNDRAINAVNGNVAIPNKQ